MIKHKLLTILTILLSFLTISFNASAKSKFYSHKLCNDPNYKCIIVKKGQTWKSLFKSEKKINFVKRLNRRNNELYKGLKIVVPKNFNSVNLKDISPFPKYLSDIHDKKYDVPILLVDQSELAWGAYNKNGKLIKWGPISGGKNYCPDTGTRCKTILGEFTAKRKQGKNCVSKKFPIGKGGAPMPYCMFFHGGYALHGSYKVPGYDDSHGCIRLFIDDARWLNEEFVKIGITKIVIQKDTDLET